MLTPPRTVVRREAGLYALERALQRRGFRHVAGADEAGRGACAGPLVAAAAMLPEGRRGEIEGLADSKLLTPASRERVYAEVVARALAYAGGGHPGRRGRRPRAARVQPGRDAPGARLAHHPPGVRADRRLRRRRPGRARAGGVEGRPGGGLCGGGQRARQGHPGPDHGGAGRGVPGVRLRRAQGLHHRRSTPRRCGSTGRAGSTGSRTSMSPRSPAATAGRRGPDGPAATRPEEPMERSWASGGTVGVALGEQPRPPAPVGEDVAMEGGVR